MASADERVSTAGEPRTAVIAVAVGVLSISFAAIFFELAEPTHPLVAAGVRLALAAIVLAPFTWRTLRARKMSRAAVRAAGWAGLLYAIHFGTWVTSLSMTSVAASVTLVTATPVLLAGAALVTGRDRPDRRHLWAIVLGLVGLVLIGGHDLGADGDALAGDALAIAGAASMAVFLLLVRRLGSDLDVWAFSGIACAVGAGILLACALVARVPIAVPSVEAFGWLAAAAIVPQLAGHGALTWALRHLRPTVVGMATVGEPVGATLLAWLWLGETVSAVVAIGCAVTIAAVLIAVWEPRSISPPRSSSPRRS